MQQNTIKDKKEITKKEPVVTVKPTLEPVFKFIKISDLNIKKSDKDKKD